MTRSRVLLRVGLVAQVIVGATQWAAAQVSTPEIRIVSLKHPEQGRTLTLQGFRELGAPCFSKDGKWLAFDAYRNGFNESEGECWIIDREGQNGKRLAGGATPRWMPDGNSLIFMREKAIDRARPAGIYSINRDGTGERWICDGRWPDPSPDGKTLVFSTGGAQGLGLRPGAMICTSKINGTDRKEIIQGDCPCWSPDGKKISFGHQIGNRKATMRIYDFTTDRDATLGVGWMRGNWLPAGTGVVCNTWTDNRESLVFYSIDPALKNFGIVIPDLDAFYPCPSIDGEEIVFVCKRR